MSVAFLSVQKLLGLFELDDAGKVLYYRMDSTDELPDMTGHNFYDEVAGFENVEAFRRCVRDFTRSAKAADSFDFDFHYKGSDQPVRVLLARIRENLNQLNTKSVLVHIRGGEHSQDPDMRGEVDERDVD